MADGIELTPGSGVQVSTVELDVLDGSVVDAQHVQRISLVSINDEGVGRDVRFDPYPFERTEALLSRLIAETRAQTILIASMSGFKGDIDDLVADAARGTQ